MRVWRILPYAMLAAFLAGCAATGPLLPEQETAAAPIAEPERAPAAEQATQVQVPKLPAPKPAPTSTASRNNAKPAKRAANAPTPTIGSAEWKRERAEDERKEEHIKKVIEGICSGC